MSKALVSATLNRTSKLVIYAYSDGTEATYSVADIQQLSAAHPERPGDVAQLVAWETAEEVELTPEEVAEQIRRDADYKAFWLALLQTGAYQAIRAQASENLAMNTAATEFIALLGDAKMGHPLEPAIQQAITAVLTVGTFTESDLLEFQAALVAGSLEQIYTLEVP